MSCLYRRSRATTYRAERSEGISRLLCKHIETEHSEVISSSRSEHTVSERGLWGSLCGMWRTVTMHSTQNSTCFFVQNFANFHKLIKSLKLKPSNLRLCMVKYRIGASSICFYLAFFVVAWKFSWMLIWFLFDFPWMFSAVS